MQRCLIIGASGFIGRNILEILPKELSLLIITTNPKKIKNILKNKYNSSSVIIKNYKFVSPKNKKTFQDLDIIINAIGAYPKGNNEKILKLLNFSLPKKIFNLAANNKFKRFININTVLRNRKSDYVYYKHKLSDFLKINKKNTCILDLHVSHVYGDVKNSREFINYIIRQIKLKKKFINLTTGNQIRDVIHINDFKEFFLKLLKINFEKKYNKLEVGSFKSYSIKYLVQKIKKKSNSKIKLNFGALNHKNGEDFFAMCRKKSLKKISWKPKISLNVGLNILIRNSKVK